ncbi:MAG: DJ-1 family protein [Halothiobacillus sp. 20-53-49]|nr:DJ-1/PfpI family protein [Halothiobacillaceae bacterium]OYV46569.1 MAG: DJ-1 family protein [Halothiobacillus sp. 20-53-49]OYY55439.1 MAG: DJ-1 family protein [Halothiobacillus sp. 28-55-5]HUM99602.1 DJ-1/PfpI family protein [Halothiobacillus sp.]
MSPKALILLAPGFEDLEAVTLIDLLRRAKFQVSVFSLRDDEATGSRGTRIHTEGNLALLDKQTPFDLIVLPGGQPGSDNLAADARVLALLKTQAAAGRFVAAMCAAPKVLAKAGLTQGKRITHYPGALTPQEQQGAIVTGNPVEVDGKLITGRSPGTAMDFALTLIEHIAGAAQRQEVEAGLVR